MPPVAVRAKYPPPITVGTWFVQYRRGTPCPWVIWRNAPEDGRALETLDEACDHILDGVTDAEMAACVALMSVEVVDPVREAVRRTLDGWRKGPGGSVRLEDAIVALVDAHAAPEVRTPTVDEAIAVLVGLLVVCVTAAIHARTPVDHDTPAVRLREAA